MQKDLRIEDVEQWTDLGWEWKLGWRRDWFEWEKPNVEALFRLLQQFELEGQGDDNWVWKGIKESNYSVKDAYSKIRGNMRVRRTKFIITFGRSKLF